MKSIFNKTIINPDHLFTEPQGAQSIVYEVLRFIDGIPLFAELHMERMIRSCQIINNPLKPDFSQFETQLNRLIEGNELKEGNIMCKLFYFDNRIDELFLIIPHAYPTDEQYQNGVKTALLTAERSNPEAKVVQQTLREQANQLMIDAQLYEVLLVNNDGLITEGSRSNLFFIQGNKLISAPAHTILKGITFLKIIEICKSEGIEINFDGVQAHSIAQYDAAFLSGTSPKILPIKQIDSIDYSVENPLIQKLKTRYNSEIDKYIASKR